MTDVVGRLRIWPAADGNDALSVTFVESLMREAADEIERLRAALRPFAAGVFNDNGDMTVTTASFDAYVAAFAALRPRRAAAPSAAQTEGVDTCEHGNSVGTCTLPHAAAGAR